MGNVFANGREISGKSAGNKVIAAMPDVCMSPPPPPAGPLPLPYPNFSNAGDTADGSKDVVIGDKPASLKNSSSYKSSKGDEAATRNFGAGVVSHGISGAVKYVAWSMDVLIEGQNVVRQLDLAMGNHGSATNGPLAPGVAAVALVVAGDSPCEKLGKANDEDREKLSEDKGLKGSDNKPEARTTVAKVGTGNTTITNGVLKMAGAAAKHVKACSRALAAKYDPAFETGLCKDDVEKKTSNMDACAPGFQYKTGNNRPHQSHTESRLIESALEGMKGKAAAAAGSLGTLTMKINWRTKGDFSTKPCPNCERVICAAKECGLKIMLCGEEGKPVEPKCKNGEFKK